MRTLLLRVLMITALGLMISGCSTNTPQLPDPKMVSFTKKKHEPVGKIHGIRGTLIKDGRNWALKPNSKGVYLCIKVKDYKKIKQRCNDTGNDLKICEAINKANVSKCNALVKSYKG